jgi:CspA family cold shock protein
VDLDPPAGVRLAVHLAADIDQMPIGTVKWFNPTKGFGFIQPEDGSKDVFLHISDVQRSGLQEPREGDKLSYELQKGQQGKVSAGNLKTA